MVVVGLLTKCANQVASCVHGHVDMLTGNHAAQEGVDFWYWCLCMAYLMHLDAVKTHTHAVVPFPLFYCIEVMGGALGL